MAYVNGSGDNRVLLIMSDAEACLIMDSIRHIRELASVRMAIHRYYKAFPESADQSLIDKSNHT